MNPLHINYVYHRSILVINSRGKIRQLYVPFKVKVLLPTEYLKEGSNTYVEEVQTHAVYLLIYRVGNSWLPYYLFEINIHF